MHRIVDLQNNLTESNSTTVKICKLGPTMSAELIFTDASLSAVVNGVFGFAPAFVTLFSSVHCASVTVVGAR